MASGWYDLFSFLVWTSSGTALVTVEPDDQIGVDQHQGGTYYPFLSPSNRLNLLIADVFFGYVDDDNLYKPPFKFDWLYGFGVVPATPDIVPVHDWDAQLSDEDDNVVFDTREASSFQIINWQPDKEVAEWIKGDEVLRIVFWYPTSSLSFIRPTDARLDPRAFERFPRSLRGVHILNEDGEILLPVGKALRFSTGYNIDMRTKQPRRVDGGLVVNDVHIDAVPGAGLGRFPGCDEEKPIRRINGIPANQAGNFFLDALQCIRVEPKSELLQVNPERQVQLVPNTVLVLNDCEACVSCDDFVDIYECIRSLFEEARALGKRIAAARDSHNVNVAEWSAAGVARGADRTRGVIVAFSPLKVGVAGAYCNDGVAEFSNLKLEFAFTSSASSPLSETLILKGGDTLTSDSGNVRQGRIKTTLAGSWPNYSVTFNKITYQDLAYVSFLLTFDSPDAGEAISLSVTAKDSGDTALGPSASASGTITA